MLWDVIKQQGPLGTLRAEHNKGRQRPPLCQGWAPLEYRTQGKNGTNQTPEVRKVWRSILELRLDMNKTTYDPCLFLPMWGSMPIIRS